MRTSASVFTTVLILTATVAAGIIPSLAARTRS